MFTKHLLSTLAIASTLLALGPLVAFAESADAPSKPQFEKVVVFGDSLSDPGNFFVLTGQYTVRPFAPPSSRPRTPRRPALSKQGQVLN